MATLCNHKSNLILKFAGVFPLGLNRLHAAIENINGESPFKEVARIDAKYRPKVELIASKFSREHGSYVVKIRVPYMVHSDQPHEEDRVPQSVIVQLLDSVGEFQPE